MAAVGRNAVNTVVSTGDDRMHGSWQELSVRVILSNRFALAHCISFWPSSWLQVYVS